MADDPFLYPGTNVLRNRKGFRDAAKLDRFEAQATAVRIAQLESAPVEGAFDLKHLQAVHRHIFQDVYPWAGQLRHGTGMMNKVRLGRGVTYGSSDHVPDEAARVFRKLSSENNLRGLVAGEFSQRLAFYYSELDAIHPFREGNSRTLRSFTSQLAEKAGHTVDWSRLGQSEETRNALYRARDLAVMTGETGPLSGLIAGSMVPVKSAVATILTVLEKPKPVNEPPWAPAPVPMAERIAAFERKEAERAKKLGSAVPEPEPDTEQKPSQGPKP